MSNKQSCEHAQTHLRYACIIINTGECRSQVCAQLCLAFPWAPPRRTQLDGTIASLCVRGAVNVDALLHMCITAWLEEERRIVMCLQEEYAIRTKVDAAVESSGMAQTVMHLVCAGPI